MLTSLDRDALVQDLLTNPRYQALWQPYHPEAVASFAKTYASNKVEWHFWGAKAEASQTHGDGTAYSRLWDIQRKKLFDLQCRWRAGQATPPGLDCTADFEAYDAAIENCPVLPPITPEELAMYCDFVRQASDYADDVLDAAYVDDGLPRDWQDYVGMRRYEEEFEQNTPDDECRGVAPPAWYDFHNARTGAGSLLRLPDVRGPREAPYFEAYYAARRAADPPRTPPADPRPTFLTFAQEEALEAALVQQFESPRLRRYRAAYEREQAHEQANEQLEADFAFLRDLDAAEAVPIEAGPDWRAALRRAAAETRRNHLLASLPQVYDEYCLRQNLGISHPEADEPTWRNQEGAQARRECLLDGRELLGEPRNFDF